MSSKAADEARALIAQALDPTRSVVVEACAGSGKTWLLASRVLRLLLADVLPGEILAITFTRKAAREIEERVVGWLHLLATVDDAQVRSFLTERGVLVNADVLAKARGLYERVLSAKPGLAVNTFHGWFLQLVDAAPLSANLAGATLVDAGGRVFDELWQSFAALLQRDVNGDLAKGFVRLLDIAGLEAVRSLIRRGFDRRGEWLAFGDGAADIATRATRALGEQLGIVAPGQALDDFFESDWASDFQPYLGFLEKSELQNDQEQAVALRGALCDEMVDDDAKRFDVLRSVFLTRENSLRSRKPSKALDKRFSPDGAMRFLALHASLGERLIDCLEKQTAERIFAFNADAFIVFEAFLAHVAAFKAARRQIDFVDAEWNVLKLLRDEETAAFLQARLDARYRHVLLDEFQDTNPLQWQILLAWLDAYSDAARPGIFLVGDPKQSIYRFRRAEPRLFSVATDFLVTRFGAARCEQDATRRNAQAIVDVVNALFLDEPAFAPFRHQTSFAGVLPGRVEILPLCMRDDSTPGVVDASVGESTVPLRDPLRQPAVELEDARLGTEAAVLAKKIGEIVGVWQVDERGADGVVASRPLRYGDIMLLVRTRTNLAIYERALSAANIPFDGGARGGLLTALEVRDVLALLEFFVTPVADLKLAHALRSPLFACSDDDLLQLATTEGDSWWSRLKTLATVGKGSRQLTRAARLLEIWLDASERLPTHDLLDRIFHEGEVIERYRRAVSPATAASVEANLRALLLLTLDLDGGRYPSLPRCIEELRELQNAEANDSPDEGEIASLHVDAGRVRILTIHGAKGLEAPVVWLLGANAAPRSQGPWDLLVEWPPADERPSHLSFFGVKDDRGRARQALFEAEAKAARREELNLLYVALTRARQVFFASGIDNPRAPADTPYRLLEAALDRLGGALSHGNGLPEHRSLHAVSSTPTKALVNQPLPNVGERRLPVDAAARFGILLHALLERGTNGVAPDGWWLAHGFDDTEYQRVRPVAERLLSSPALQRFFDPARYRRAWNEVELAGPDGTLIRIDRLVDADGAFWVLDYKSSGSDTRHLADYQRQVVMYCRSVGAVFPGETVHGALIFSDASLYEIC